LCYFSEYDEIFGVEDVTERAIGFVVMAIMIYNLKPGLLNLHQSLKSGLNPKKFKRYF